MYHLIQGDSIEADHATALCGRKLLYDRTAKKLVSATWCTIDTHFIDDDDEDVCKSCKAKIPAILVLKHTVL